MLTQCLRSQGSFLYPWRESSPLVTIRTLPPAKRAGLINPRKYQSNSMFKKPSPILYPLVENPHHLVTVRILPPLKRTGLINPRKINMTQYLRPRLPLSRITGSFLGSEFKLQLAPSSAIAPWVYRIQPSTNVNAAVSRSTNIASPPFLN